ncbi:aldo/keto reductase [Nonomuraea sp. K274]|uniref:Aldo/keto reductase n=1 Tax=Nonomuraea cypriaca TaxID=1187855 RepID=A0A931EZG1_9ACTN|nr:aldo/keto reductase [Nonomuraea cypriaca]MBF8189814.1 aldo/keto reductase [Nonomuraea cypriaca]
MNTTAAAGGHFLLGGDLRVNRLGFGAMRLALGGSVRGPEAGIAVLRRATELGVNHIDTAGFYGFGDLHAHELIREALSPYPEDLVLATKVGPLLEGGVVPTGQATPDQLRGLVEEDLRRLGRDRFALAWLLATSPVTLAIPGTSSLDHLTENIAAAGLRLTSDDLAELP